MSSKSNADEALSLAWYNLYTFAVSVLMKFPEDDDFNSNSSALVSSFLALLIAEDKAFAGYLFSSRFNSSRQLLITLSWSSVSRIMKVLSNPRSSICLLSIRTISEWNVPTQREPTSAPISPSILFFISAAALFVNVRASILYGLTPRSLTRCAIL